MQEKQKEDELLFEKVPGEQGVQFFEALAFW
jgi:hypothetical protein